MAGLGFHDLLSLTNVAERQCRKYARRLAKSTFTPEPGKRNFDEVSLEKWKHIHNVMTHILEEAASVPEIVDPPAYEIFVEASMLDDWKTRYEVLTELRDLRQQLQSATEEGAR